MIILEAQCDRQNAQDGQRELCTQVRARELCRAFVPLPSPCNRLGSARGKPALGAWLAPLLDWRGLCQIDPHTCMKPVALDDNSWCFPSREGHFTAGASFQQTLESCCKLAPDTGGTNAFRTDCHKSLHCETPAPGLESYGTLILIFFFDAVELVCREKRQVPPNAPPGSSNQYSADRSSPREQAGERAARTSCVLGYFKGPC